VANNSTLESLELICAGLHNGARHVAAMIDNNTGLKSLNIFQNRMDDNGVASIAQSLPNNTTLKFNNLSHTYTSHEKDTTVANTL